MGGGLSVKGFKGCGLVVGRKGIYSRVLAETFFMKNALLGWPFFQKKVDTGWEHLMHAIGIGIESP